MMDPKDETQSPVWVFTPLFVSVVVYAGLVRMLDTYMMVTSTLVGYFKFWLDPVIGVLSFGDLILSTVLVFFGLSIHEMNGNLKSPARWITMMTCLLLVSYIVFLCLNVRSFAEL